MMLIVFDIKGIIMIEWVFQCQTVNQKYYLQILIKLKERMRKTRPDFCKNNVYILHQDNAPAHNAFLVKSNSWLINTSQYSSNHRIHQILPLRFYFFTKLKNCFEMIDISSHGSGENKSGGPTQRIDIWWFAALLWTTEEMYIVMCR